jgi:hypothetical protein
VSQVCDISTLVCEDRHILFSNQYQQYMSVFKQGLIVLVIGILLLVFPEIVTLNIIEDWFIAMGVVLIFIAIVIILSDMIYRSFGSK